MAKKTDIGLMAEEALDQLSQAVHGGQYKTPSGKVMPLDTDQHIRVLTWAAQQRERKPKILDTPDDLQVKTTAH